jgi:S-DNA-T family DNA segregation ATPase FtsK/SpoIIIE
MMITARKWCSIARLRPAGLCHRHSIHRTFTQRPSLVNDYGCHQSQLLAGFPSQTSKIDSRTILTFGGADQLVGQGDMLFSAGSTHWVQCLY